MPDSELITLDLNVFDGEGVVVDGTTADLTREQISDIVDHAAQIVLQRRDGKPFDGILDELDDALAASGVIDLPHIRHPAGA